MSPMRSSRKPGRRTRATIQWRLHVTRLGSFLGNARALRGLADDARDKLEEDYIFDGLYPVTLVDRAIEGLEGLLFDAAVLGVETRRLEERFGRCKTDARAHGGPAPAGGVEADEEPEVGHLRAVLAWLEGPAPGGGEAVMDLAHDTVDAAFEAFRRDGPKVDAGSLARVALPGGLEVEVLDLGGGLAPSAGPAPSLGDLRCAPLRLVLAGAVDGPSDEPPRPPSGARWLAVVDPFHVSLRRLGEGSGLFLEASLTGRHATDWLFVYGAAGAGDQADLADGIRSEPTRGGGALWRPGGDRGMEEALVRVGARILGGPRGPSRDSRGPSRGSSAKLEA